MNFLFVDLDHTLFHSHWRDKMIDGKNWDRYHEASVHDRPVTEMVALVTGLWSVRWVVIALTTREEKWRKLTNESLLKYEIPIDVLLMRPNNDKRPSGELKIAIYNDYVALLPEQRNVIMIDDRESVVAEFKANNITVLQAHIKRSNNGHSA